MSRAIDPARAALIRYLGGCIRARLRAEALLAARQAREQAAVRQIAEYQAASVKTVEQMLADARMAKRRRNVRGRSR